MSAKLYMSEWVNPRPGLKIAKLVLRAAYVPSMMNPMLLAVTAVHPRLAARPSDRPLPSAKLLVPAKPVGVPYDLGGGKDESERRYVAPDGTVIAAETIFNAGSDKKASGFSQDWRSYVGLVTLDGQQAARTDKLIFIFPKPVPLTGALVTGCFREPRKTQNSPPMICDIFLDVSSDGGNTWQETGAVRATSPEEHGPVWMPLGGEDVTAVRLRQTPGEGVISLGFSAGRTKSAM